MCASCRLFLILYHAVYQIASGFIGEKRKKENFLSRNRCERWAKHAYHNITNQKAILRISMDMHRFLGIFFVVFLNCIHSAEKRNRCGLAMALQICCEIDMQLLFIAAVSLQIPWEVIVVRRCKSVHNVVDQFAQSIVISKL